MVIANSKGKHLYANRRASELLLYSVEELLNTELKDLAHPDAYPILQKRLQDRIAGRLIPTTYETIIRRKDGTSFHADVTGTKTLWHGEECDLVIFRDITERNQKEINLIDSEKKYRHFVENALVGVLRSKINGEIIYVNDAIVRMLEFDSREELINAGAFMRYKFPSQRDEFIKMLQRDGKVNGFEANILTKKGNERIFLYSLILIGDTIDGTLIDITDRKHAEQKAIESQQFLKTITSEVQEVIFALDAQGVFTFSEGKGLEKLGLKPGQVVGLSVFDVYKDFPEVLEGLRKALAGNIVKTEGLELGNLKFNTNYQPIFDANGQVTSVVGLSVNVTEAKNAEKALNEHAIRLQSLLELNQMTHESFDTILDFVLNASQRMTGSEFSFVGMVDREEIELKVVRWSKGVMDQCKMDTGPLSFRVSETGLLCECIRTRQPVFVNNYSEAHPAKKGIPMGHVPITRMMAVPITDNGRVVSVISIANKPDEYTTDDALGITSLLNKMQEISRWHEVDEALKLSEEKFRTMADFTHDWELWSAPDGTYRYVSPSCKRITGYTAEEFMSNPYLILQITHTEDQSNFSEHIYSANHEEREQALNIDFRIVTAGGETRWISHTCAPVYGDGGKWLGRRISNRDITERKVAEEAMRQSEIKYRNLFDNSGTSIIILDRNGTYLMVNENAAQQFGVAAQEIIGHSMFELMPKNNAQEYFEQNKQLIDTGGHREYEDSFILNGEQKTYLIVDQAIQDEKGHYYALQSSSVDITERKQAESALLKANETLETQYALLDALINSPDEIIIFSLDNNYCYTTFNENHRQEMLKIWNANIQLGDSILDYMNILEISALAKISIDRALSGEYFTEIQHQPDADIYYELNWNPILKDKDIVGVTVFVHNISERKKSEIEIKEKNEELQNLNATKDKFFSIIAHDLRSPFNSFLGLTQMMAEDLPSLTMSQVQDLAVGMSKSATNLNRLLENLLQWARIQQGAISFNPQKIQLNPILTESIEIIIESAKNKVIEIRTDFIDDLTVFADTNLLQTVIRNLVSNAVKFTSKGGKVVLSAKTITADIVEIAIKDNGIGMDRALVDNLFKLDVQTSRRGTEGEPSSGLGLLLCKEFVEKHGGKIWAESEVGKGSTFYFTIPTQRK